MDSNNTEMNVNNEINTNVDNSVNTEPNINNETNKKKKRKIKKKILIILLFALILLGVGGYFITDMILKEVNGDPKLLKLELVGEEEIVLKLGETYEDEGATASYKDNDLTSDIDVENDIDYEHIGEYKYSYSVKYKKQKKEIERVVKVIDDIAPTIKLKGRENMKLVIGNEFKDDGAIANDNYDGDLTEKIVVDNSSLDINTLGDYKVKYTATDSSGNEVSVERNIKVVEKPSGDLKIPVLNYHFFYEDYDQDWCREMICLNMKKFREQLQYLNDNDYYTLTMDEFVRWMYGEIDLPERSVLLTIDDGAHGTSKINGNHIGPALQQYDVYATLFLITGWWDIENYRTDHLDIRSHTYDLHYEAKCGYRSKVNCISYDELVEDLKKSIEVVDNNTDSFCFPYYEYNETSLRAVKDVGFKVAFVGGYRKASRNDDKFKIPRYPIHDSISMSEFKNMIS